MSDLSKPSLSYKDAGVDIDAGDALVARIKDVAKRTQRPEVMGGLGGFGALCQLPSGYIDPVLGPGTGGGGPQLQMADRQWVDVRRSVGVYGCVGGRGHT